MIYFLSFTVVARKGGCHLQWPCYRNLHYSSWMNQLWAWTPCSGQGKPKPKDICYFGLWMLSKKWNDVFSSICTVACPVHITITCEIKGTRKQNLFSEKLNGIYWLPVIFQVSNSGKCHYPSSDHSIPSDPIYIWDYFTNCSQYVWDYLAQLLQYIWE